MTQTSVAVEDLIVEELLAVRSAEWKLASELKSVGQNNPTELRSASARLKQLQTRLDLLATLLDHSPMPTAPVYAFGAQTSETVLACA